MGCLAVTEIKLVGRVAGTVRVEIRRADPQSTQGILLWEQVTGRKKLNTWQVKKCARACIVTVYVDLHIFHEKAALDSCSRLKFKQCAHVDTVVQ